MTEKGRKEGKDKDWKEKGERLNKIEHIKDKCGAGPVARAVGRAPKRRGLPV